MSNFYLWLNEAKTGPYTIEAVWRMLDGGNINPDMLCCEDGGPDEWTAIKDEGAFAAGRAMRAAASPNAWLKSLAEGEHRAHAVRETEPETLIRAGRQFVTAAKGLIMLSGIVVVCAIGCTMGVGVGTDRQPEPALGAFIFSGVCLAIATWFYLIGQVVLIRAALDRKS